MWYIVEVDGIWRACICKNNKADKYGEKKLFSTKKKAQEWIDRHNYKGMSFRYEIKENKNEKDV